MSREQYCLHVILIPILRRIFRTISSILKGKKRWFIRQGCCESLLFMKDFEHLKEFETLSTQNEFEKVWSWKSARFTQSVFATLRDTQIDSKLYIKIYQIHLFYFLVLTWIHTKKFFFNKNVYTSYPKKNFRSNLSKFIPKELFFTDSTLQYLKIEKN